MKPLRSILIVGLVSLISACGSDDSQTVSQPEPELPNKNNPFPNVFGPPVQHTMLGKQVHFYWNEKEANNGDMLRVPPKSKPIVVSGDEVIRWLDENHNGESLRNSYVKTYKPGNFSSFDIFVYVVENRKDEVCQRWEKEPNCKLEVKYQWDEDRRTFDYSINGEDNWLFAQDYSAGIEHEEGFWGLEITEHHRPDQVLAKDELSVGIASYDKTKVDFYKQYQRDEVSRLNANDGKLILNYLQILGLVERKIDPEKLGMVQQYIIGYVDDYGNPGTMPGNPGSKELHPLFSDDVTLAQIDDNGKPKTHWGYLQGSKFIPCGISGQDCVWPHIDQEIINLEVTAHNIRPDYFYDGVITFSDIALSLEDYVDENGNKPYSGSLVYWPTLNTKAKVESYAINAINGLGSSGFYGWNFGWNYLVGQQRPDMNIGGGQATHIMPDMAQLTSPYDAYFAYTSMYDKYYAIQKNIAGDDADPYRLTRQHVLKPKYPLPETHFGRGVADCGMCHNETDMNFDSETSAHIGEVKPAECAECHGNNGAKKGHNQVAGCYRCHQDMTGHADANTANKTTHPFEKTGSGLSKVMPDPYACVSCHYNDNPEKVGGL